MKIAHFVNPWLPVTQNWIYNQIVQNKECEHLILCRTLKNKEQFNIENIFAAHPDGGLCSWIDMTLSRIRARYPRRYFHSVIEKNKPDVLHGHFAWESWRNISLIKEMNIPLVTTFYGLDVNKHPRKPYWQKRYVTLFKTGALFTVEGPFMGASLERLGCPKKKIRVIHLGVDIEKLTLLKKTQCGETFNILFVGLEREKKGGGYAAEAFLRACQHHPHLRLHIIGDGRYRKKVNAILRQGGVLDKALFHGYVTVDRYHDLLRNMDCLLAPSITAHDGDTEGGAPVSVIEAQAIGIPVIGTTHCDIPEIVKHGKTGLLCQEKDVEMLSSNLVRLISDKGMYEHFNQAARVHIQQQHDIHSQTKKLTTLYSEVIESYVSSPTPHVKVG